MTVAIIDRSSHHTSQLGCRYRTKWLTLYKADAESVNSLRRTNERAREIAVYVESPIMRSLRPL